MAGPQHIPLHGSFHCPFSVAVRYLELRDLASAYEAPDIFLIDWPDGLLERLFWVLWDALERGLVHADLDKVQEISPQRWRGDRAQVEEWQRFAEHWPENGLRFFTRHVAAVLAHAFIRVDELVATFPPLKEESPTPELPEPTPAPASQPEPSAEEVIEGALPSAPPAPRSTKPQSIASLLQQDYPAGRPRGFDTRTMEDNFRRRHPEIRFEHSSDPAKPARTFQTALTLLKWTKKK